MVDILSMVDLTSISAMLAAIGVTVGVVFAILELRNLVKARQTSSLDYIQLSLAKNFKKHGRKSGLGNLRTSIAI